MKVALWGTRGSLPTAGPDTARYGGNTACVEVRGDDGTLLVLDAGTGIRPLGASLEQMPPRVDIPTSCAFAVYDASSFGPTYRFLNNFRE